MIEIYIRNGNKEASFKTETLNAKQIDVLIQQIFEVLKSRVESKTVHIKPEITVPQNKEPEHWKTGILNKDGKPHYKIRLECPYCGTKKNLYREMGIETVQCVQCGKVVRVEPATEKGFGTTEEYRDQFGNFMLARQPYSRPRVLPKVDAENRSSFTIAELVGGDAHAVGQSG